MKYNKLLKGGINIKKDNIIKNNNSNIINKNVKEKLICCICGNEINNLGNCSHPLSKSGLCCDRCNKKVVETRNRGTYEHIGRTEETITTKEIAYQLMWALERDLGSYIRDKNVKLKFEVTKTCIIIGQPIFTEEETEMYHLREMGYFAVWIDYSDILWTILNYNKKLEEYKEYIDKLDKMVKEHTL